MGFKASTQKPCVPDLRATFAVHRITSWIRKKEDLGTMLPALATYMGNVPGLQSTERYVKLTPARFEGALNKLSPPFSDGKWQPDTKLLEVLAAL